MGTVPRSAPLPGRIRSVVQAVVDDPTADHSLKTMAGRAGVSVRHLNRLFARHTGITPARYVELARVGFVEELLRRSRAPLAAIARRAGFGSVETMRRAFLRAGHVPPGAYRERTKATEGKR
jgi:transcriptional regulator GlxA family with amidase domain